MTKFTPEISIRDTEELIAIANSTSEDWQEDAKSQAIEELKERNVSKEEQDRVVSKWEKEHKQFEENYRKQLLLNATESYKIIDILKIIIFAPLYLVGKGFDYDSIWNLRKENYTKKVIQRIIAILSGLALWGIITTVSVKISEIERLEEIEAVDISDWEENRINKNNNN